MERPSDAAVAVRAGRILHLFLWDLRRPKAGARSPYLSRGGRPSRRMSSTGFQGEWCALLPSEDAKRGGAEFPVVS